MTVEPSGAPGAGPVEQRRVEQRPSFPALEEAILAYWAADGTFQASVDLRPGGPNEYVLYDGPPFANGLPHYGHLLTGFVKDTVPRYQTMRGRRVERRFGWDCHGLPAEMEAERELGLPGRAAIRDYGVGRYNDYCRQLVQRTTDVWQYYVQRQARWVDFENGYRTMDLSYMESVIWAFKRLWEKGLAYEGYRVLPYCWECETPLSNFETRQDDAYRPREDPAVTVSFELETSEPTGPGPLRALVWTTTPWTLPSNLALAVGPELRYVVVDTGDARYLVGEDRLDAYDELLGHPARVSTVAGSELVGLRYRPLFEYFTATPGAFRVLAGDFVATDEGTGVVHLAPGFGEDDQRVCEEAGMPVICPVDERGRFTDEVPAYAGRQVFEANPEVIDDLASAGALVAQERYTHSYPHCWRSDTPLIYRAMTSWFVRVTAIKDRMVELNHQINWVPEHLRDGAFGKWLEGARDWSISRNRFWGAPIPVWKSDDPRYPRVDVYGSLDEIEADFGVRLGDLHRPAVDELTRPNPDDPSGSSTMRRVEDVMDCWFESGSMPFAQLHYPFEQVERFESHFPADFIVEYVGQTRGWFYTLHVLSTALFDCPPFRTCLAHGVILGHDGRKLSKRLGNYPDPLAVFAEEGADAMRWFLLSSPGIRGQDLMVDRKAVVEALRQVISPIWSAWYFLSLYADADGVEGRFRTDASGLLDRYALARTSALVEEVTGRLDSYDLAGACAAVTSFLDVLNNWYIRRSRARFWRASAGDADADQQDAHDTLTTVLTVLCRLVAPLLPLVSEAVHRGLTGARSVHLSDWPSASDLPSDPALVARMEMVRDVCSAAHSVRKANHLRARLPLASLRVVAPHASELAPFSDLIAEEVNVSRVDLSDDVEEAADLVLSVDPALVGPRLGADTQKVLDSARRGEWRLLGDGTVEVAGITLAPDQATLRLRPRDERSSRALPGNEGVVCLDLTVTEELRAAGLARDVVRAVQRARRQAGLDVSDRIHLSIGAPAEVVTTLTEHRAYLCEQTLAVELDLSGGTISSNGAASSRAELSDGTEITIATSKV